MLVNTLERLHPPSPYIDDAPSCPQVLQEYVLIMGGLRASKRLHANLLERVMRLPMSFFDSQPSGRLLNRFTKDTAAVDTEILVSILP